jgi:hypothetical protein
MRNYQNIPLSLWEEDHKDIGPDGLLVLLFLMSNPRAQFSGLYRLTRFDPQRVEMTPEQFFKALSRCVTAGRIDFDPQFLLVRVNGWWEHWMPKGKSQLACLIDKELKPLFNSIGPHQFVCDLASRVHHTPGLCAHLSTGDETGCKQGTMDTFNEIRTADPLPIIPQDGSILKLENQKKKAVGNK